MATIKDVAERSGVSKATVSYILNNQDIPIKAETRDRVLEVMRELNYRPQSARSPRARKQTDTFGVVFPPLGGPIIDQPYYFPLLSGILLSASECKRNALVFNIEDWGDAHKNIRRYCDGSCDGLILIGPSPTGNLVTALKERGIPFVLVNAGSQQPDISCVDIDNEAVAAMAVHHLVEAGHRRIAMLLGSDHDSTQLRERGFRRELGEAGLACQESWIIPGEYSAESGYRRTLALLQAEPAAERPTAILCGNDLIAQGAYRALSEVGLLVPGDISVIGIDDQAFAAQMVPPLTTLRQPLHEIGERAVRLLLSKIEESAQKERTVSKDFLPVELIRRGSVARPAA